MPANPHNDNAFYGYAGSAAGGFLGGPFGAGLGYAAGNVLGEAFGSSAVDWKGKYFKNQMQDKTKYDPGYSDAMQAVDEKYRNRSIRGRVKDAKAAGLHPLFALGATPPAGGSGANTFIPGQTPEGSLPKAAMRGIGAGLEKFAELSARKDLATHEATLSALTRATQLAMVNRRPPPDWGAQPQKTRRKEVPTEPGKGEDKKRGYVSPQGVHHGEAIPKGTPQEVLEAEFGDLATLFPHNFERAVSFLQETGQIVTKKNLLNILNYLENMRRPMEQTTGPWKPSWKHPGARRTRRPGAQPYKPKHWRNR